MRARDDDIEEVSDFEVFACFSQDGACYFELRYVPHFTVAWPRGTSRSQVLI
jgi:hypothetical protein